MSEQNGGQNVARSDDESLELDALHPNSDKRTRFQVNRVRTESHNPDQNGAIVVNLSTAEDDHTDDDDLHSVTDRTRLNSEYAKSFR